jgi:hypothetical protein
VHSKEGWSVQLKIMYTHILGDNVRPILKWEELSMGLCKELFLLRFISPKTCVVPNVDHGVACT